jgi:hypothetical protein
LYVQFLQWYLKVRGMVLQHLGTAGATGLQLTIAQRSSCIPKKYSMHVSMY